MEELLPRARLLLDDQDPIYSNSIFKNFKIIYWTSQFKSIAAATGPKFKDQK